jgi:AcrR family transcriptional regulator
MDNKNKILDCALDLFSNKGYDGVGVQEIVIVANVTKPTLYHYFGSKKGLLESLVKQNFEQFFQNLEQNILYQGDLPLTLFRIARAFFIFASSEKNFYRMQMSMLFAPSNSEVYMVITPYFQKELKLLEDVFIQASVNHGNMKGRHTVYAATFLGMINTFCSMYFNDFIVLDDESVYKAVHQFMHGIYS